MYIHTVLGGVERSGVEQIDHPLSYGFFFFFFAYSLEAIVCTRRESHNRPCRVLIMPT